MKAIHQLVHTLSYGDAISTEVLALQNCFRSSGRESIIYAINEHPKLKGCTRPYTELDQASRDEIVLHYSLGSPLNQSYRRLTAARRTLIYHNLTPARWFSGINPRIVRDIEQGLKELPELCALSDRLIADSQFNAGELRQLGFSAEVLGLPLDPRRWSEAANPGLTALIKKNPGIHLLHVGRIAPNKCLEDIIRCFYFLNRYIEKKSYLWLPGIDIDTELYSFSLKRLVQQLDLTHAVNFAGCLADAELRALYENCTAYVCMSEHEGFCLPVAEAMHFGLPVLAYASSALPETIASGGILLHEKKYAETAELLAEVARNQELRTRLIAAGKARVSELSFAKFEQKVAELFNGERSGRVAAGA